MSRHTLTYNGIDLSTFGAYVSGEGAWKKPAPEFEQISVPGRSGDVLLYNGRYSNVDVTYKMGIVDSFDTNYSSLISCLMSDPGYHKLVDSSHPGVYRMAAVSVGVEPDMTQHNLSGQFKITFNCKPQTFLDEGDERYCLINAGSTSGTGITNTIYNPTAFPTWPLVQVSVASANGTVYLAIQKKTGQNTWSSVALTKYVVTATNASLLIDTETGNVTDATTGADMNSFLKTSQSLFAQIPGGGRITSLAPYSNPNDATVHVIPRWWRL